MVVAHPDDESLWGAGLLLRYPGNWEVICCTTPARDPERAALFPKACKILGARPRQLDQIETTIPLSFPDLSGHDLIVTHNSAGEYGHPQHKEVHEHITRKYPEKTICFGYRPHGAGEDFSIELNEEECAAKLLAIKCYDNIGSANIPTWQMLLNSFQHKFNLWREPYEFPH